MVSIKNDFDMRAVVIIKPANVAVFSVSQFCFGDAGWRREPGSMLKLERRSIWALRQVRMSLWREIL